MALVLKVSSFVSVSAVKSAVSGILWVCVGKLQSGCGVHTCTVRVHISSFAGLSKS